MFSPTNMSENAEVAKQSMLKGLEPHDELINSLHEVFAKMSYIR